jgi:hypothetical protein
LTSLIQETQVSTVFPVLGSVFYLLEDFMKEFLIGMIALLSVSLFIGCPTGEMGDSGLNTSSVDSQVVSATYLEALFETADIVTLGPSVEEVDGTVPAAKKLRVSGTTTVVAANLAVNGTVEVRKGAFLTADGTTTGGTTAGYIIGGAGSVSGEGLVVLPYEADDYLSYVDSGAANKAVGGANAATVEAIFAGGETNLTVNNLTGIAAATVPKGATLTLVGATNATTGLDLSGADAGTLIVGKDATLAVTTSITADGTTSNIINNGTLALGDATVAGKITNDGTITTTTTTQADLQAILNVGGKITATGTITALDADLTIPASAVVEVTTATFATGNFAVMVEGTATFSAATFAAVAKDITINGSATLGAAAVPLGDVKVGSNGSLTVVTGKSLTLDTDKTLTVAGQLTVTTGGSLDASAGTVIIGDATNKVTLIKATLAGGSGVGATGVLTLVNTNTLTLADAGTITVADTGKVVLPNTEFGAGTYTATNDVVISALTDGDTIKTGTTENDGLAFAVTANDKIALTSNTTSAATYTFVAVASSGEKVVFGEAADKTAAITIPGHATNNAANLTVPAEGTVVIGQGSSSPGGSIVLKHAANGGTLTVAAGTVIKGVTIVNGATNDGSTINNADMSITAEVAVDTTQEANGTLTMTKEGTFTAKTADASVTKDTSVTIGSS